MNKNNNTVYYVHTPVLQSIHHSSTRREPSRNKESPASRFLPTALNYTLVEPNKLV